MRNKVSGKGTSLVHAELRPLVPRNGDSGPRLQTCEREKHN